MTITFTIPDTRPETKVDIKPRGNGIEWEKYVDPTNTTLKKVYIPIIDGRDLGVVYHGNTSHDTILVDPITNKPINLSEHDAERVYNYIAQQIEQWHPDALASGRAHQNLLAAQQRHAAATSAATGTASLVTGGGGSSSTSNRKTRKTRKSRKARKARK